MGKKAKTHYMIVLDQSGSMESIKGTVISLFNEQIQNLRKKAKDIDLQVTTSVFNDSVNILNLGAPISNVKLLDQKNYRPDNLTALFDAVMITYNKMRGSVKKKDRVVVLVLTDGLENASKEYCSKDVQNLMDEINDKGGSFNFLCSSRDIKHYQEVFTIESDDCISFNENEVEYALRYKLNEVNEDLCF